MNLRNYQITIGELLSNPQARALLQRELPAIMRHPMLPMASAVPLSDILNYSKGYLPKSKTNMILSQLEKL